LLLLCCLYCQKTKLSNFVKTILINVISISAILSHEAFFFFGIPVIIFISCRSNEKIPHVRSFLHSAAGMIPSLIAFAAIVKFHGVFTAAHAVNHSWHDTWTYIDKVGCCFDKPNAAIAALQWGYEGGMLTSLQLLNTYSFGIYVPLAWLLTIV